MNYPATGKTYGTGHITGTTLTSGTFTFSIPFQFGNEVRLLPEPSSRSALAAGVVLLGLMGAFGARVVMAPAPRPRVPPGEPKVGAGQAFFLLASSLSMISLNAANGLAPLTNSPLM